MIDEIQNLGILPENITTKKYLDLRMAGTDTPLTIPFIEYKSMLASFGEEHRDLFGFFPSNELEIANVRVEVTGHRTKIGNSLVDLSLVKPEPIHYAKVYFDENVVNTPFYSRESLPVGFEIPGPAIIIDSNSSPF